MRLQYLLSVCKCFGILFFVLVLLILSAGCSSGGDGKKDTTPGYETYTTPGSDLVLRIPDSLHVSRADIADIHSSAENVPHCYTTNGKPVDIVLAEACIFYNFLYLYPQYFPKNLNLTATAESYISYLQTNDPFTWYMAPEEYAYFMSSFSGENAFIGFSVECAGDTISDQTPLVITEIVPFSRAWIDGLQVGDKIIGVDEVALDQMSLDAAYLLFPTQEEEPVEISVDRNGVEITIYTAAEENIGVLLYGNIAYLSVRSFSRTTGAEVRMDFNDLQAEAGGSIDKLIIDVRGDGGGSSSGALEMIDYLIDNDGGVSPITTVSGPAYEEETRYLGDYCEFNIGNFDETNFVLLVDENSASASEMLASTLKYYSTAYLIGETTYGKGIGQTVVELIDESGAVVPAFESLPPSGVSYHLVGISPDYYIAASATAFNNDPVLDAAVEYLNNGNVTVSALGAISRKRRIAVSDKSVDPLKKSLLRRNRSSHYY